MISPDGALAACRLAHYTALVFAFGAMAYLRWLAPSPLMGSVGRPLRLPIRAGLVVAFATTWLWLPLQAAEITGDWAGALDPDTLTAVLLDTALGQAWLARMVLSVPLLPLAIAWPSLGRTATIATGLLLASLSLTGHAAMQEGTIGLLHRLNHTVHVLAGGFWLGALVPFVLSLRVSCDPGVRPDAVRALRRFSTTGHVAVAAVLASGVVNIALILGRWPTDWSSPYQALLAAKITAVLAMIGLAIANRYILVPRIRRAGGSAIRAIRNGAVAEILLGVAVLSLVAVFGLLDPA